MLEFTKSKGYFKTLGELLEMLPVINFNPPYQRDVVWNGLKQQTLIAAVLQGVVPSAISLRLYEKGDKTYEVMDGKQRLTTLLLLFAANEIAITEKSGLPRDFIGKTFKELDDKLQKQVLGLRIPVVEYDCDEAHARAIFLFIQNGERVSKGEVLHSQHSNARTALMRYTRATVLNKVTGVNTKRHGKLNLLARALYLEHVGELVTLDNEAITNLIREGTPRRDLSTQKMDEVLFYLDRVFETVDRKVSSAFWLSLYWFASQRLESGEGNIKTKPRIMARFIVDFLMRLDDPDERVKDANLREWFDTGRGRSGATELEMRHRILSEEYDYYTEAKKRPRRIAKVQEIAKTA